jgi:IclR family transcriptional regulator, KDG regulon repressor
MNAKKKHAIDQSGDQKVNEAELQNDSLDNGEPAEVKSTQRIAQILMSFGPHGTSLADIVERTKLRKTTVHRLLKALAKENMVMHDALNRKYYMGSAITHFIWEPQITQAYLIECARREMENLVAFTEETVVLGILIGTNHNLIYSIQSPHQLRVVPPVRTTNRLYAGASNRVLLSQLNDAELDRTIDLMEFEPITSFTLSSREALLADIQSIRRHGYAITTGEVAVGASNFAVPVPGYVKPIVLGILGPEPRTKPRSAVFIDKLIASAVQISRNLNAKKAF